MACKIIHNEDGSINHLLASNGSRSKLFDTIRNSQIANPLAEYAKMLTPEYLEQYDGILDENAEPTASPALTSQSTIENERANTATQDTIVTEKQQAINVDAKNTAVQGLQTVADKLSKKFGIPYNVIPRQDARNILNAEGIKFAGPTFPRGFILSGVVYFVEGEFNQRTAVEEFLHPFVNALEVDNPELYQSLVDQSSEEPGIVAASTRYSDDLGFDQADRNREIVAKILSKHYSRIIDQKSTFWDSVRNAISAIKNYILDLIGVKGGVEDIPANLTYSQLAKLIDSNLLNPTLLDIGNNVLDYTNGIQFDLSTDQLAKIKEDVTRPVRARVTEINQQLLHLEDQQAKELLQQERSQLNQLIETINTGLTTQDARFVSMLAYVNKLMNGYVQNVRKIYESNESTTEKAGKIHAAKSVGDSIRKMLDNIRDIINQNIDYISEQGKDYNKEIEQSIANASEALSRIDTLERAIGKQSLLDIITSSLPKESLAAVGKEVKDRIDRDIARLQSTNKHTLQKLGDFITDSKAGFLGTLTSTQQRQQKINELEAVKAGFPSTPEMVLDLVNPDSNSGNWMGRYTTYVSMFMPNKLSQDSVVYSFKKWLDEAQQIANKQTLADIGRSKINTIIDNKKKGGFGNSIGIHKNIVKTSGVLTWNGETRKYETKDLKHLARPWSYDYDNKILEWRNLQNELEEQRDTAPTIADRQAANRKLEELREERSDWYAEHVQEKYSPVYKNAIAALPANIRAIVENYNTRRRDISERITQEYQNGFVDVTARQDMKDLDTLMRNLRSNIDENGNPKTGEDLEIAGELQQFYSTVRDFFDYEPDSKGYTDILTQLQQDVAQETEPALKQIKQDRLDKFIEENFISKIEEKWYDEIGDVFDALTKRNVELFGVDSELQAVGNGQFMTINQIWDKYREIRKLANDRNGDFDTSSLTAGQKETLELYLEIIDSYDQPKTADPQIKELVKKLKGLRKYEVSKYYQDTFNTMNDTLRQAYEKYEQSGEDGDYQSFKSYEASFKKWYDANHYDSYKPYETRVAAGKPLDQKVKRYWRKMVPVDTQNYTRREPGNLFTTAKLKDIHKNPDYQEDSTGLPMPKAVTDNGDGSYTINNPSSPYINADYGNLSALDKDHLVELRRLLYQAQKGSSRKRYGHILPALYSKTGEQILKKGAVGTLKSIATEYNEGFNSEEAGRNFNDYVQLINNTPIEAGDQSDDATESILKYYYNASLNKELSKKRAQYEAAMLYLRQSQASLPTDRKDMEADFRRAIKLIEGEGKKIVYGNFIDNDSKGAKWLDGLTRYTGKLRTFGNFIMHITNYTAGYIQNLVIAADPNIGQANAAWGFNYFQGRVVPQLMRYDGRFNDASKDVQIFRWFNLTEDGIRKPSENVSVGRLSRIQNHGGANFLKEGGETVIAGGLLFASLKAKKVMIGDKAVSLLEAIEVGDDGFIMDDNGNLRIQAGASITEKELNDYRLNMISKFIKAQGNYNRQNATEISRNVLGRFAELFRKYFPTGAVERIGARKVSFSESQEAEGFYRTLLRSLKENGTRTTMYGMFARSQNLTDLENTNLKKVRNELLYSAALFGAGMVALRRFEDKDPDEIDTIIGLNIALILLRTSSESRTFSPFPLIGGGQNAVQILNQLSIAAGTLKSGYDFLEAAAATPFALAFPDNDWLNDKAFYQSDSGYGLETGDLKLLKPLWSLTGYNSIRGLAYPKERIQFVLNPRN